MSEKEPQARKEKAKMQAAESAKAVKHEEARTRIPGRDISRGASTIGQAGAGGDGSIER